MIKVHTFTFNSFQVNTYLLFDESKEVIIVDPACEDEQEAEQLFSFINSNNLTPKAIVNTHAHVDHIVGVNIVKSKYNIPFYLNHNDQFLIDNASQSAAMFGFRFDNEPIIDKSIDESDSIKFGNSEITLFHVPGHSPGSLALHSAKDGILIVGDVLFRGSIGRTDLPGGNYDQLISGIKEKLLTLPRETKVYCGHGPTTTIGQEHDTNPFLV